MIGLVVVFGGITTPNESVPCEQSGCASRPEIAGLAFSEHVAGAARVAESVIDPPVLCSVADEGAKPVIVGGIDGSIVTVVLALPFPASFTDPSLKL